MALSIEYLLSSITLTVLAVIVALSVFARLLYLTYFHPLHHVPGPTAAKYNSLFLIVICYLGIEGRVIRHYHQKYGKVIRVAPNSVSISDANALRDIYITGGGLPKDERYRNFNLGPVATIFSSIDTNYRNQRAKAVAPLFASSQLRAEMSPEGSVGKCIAEFISQLKEFKESGIKMDLLDLCARLSIDVVTVYLLGQRYGGLRENAHLSLAAKQLEESKLSANPFIHAIVAFSRFSLLPNTLFKLVYSLSQRLGADEHVAQSFMKLDSFVNSAIGQNRSEKQSATSKSGLLYHERLLAAGVSLPEATAQSKAIIFAGADSTAVMLCTVLFHLVRNRPAQHRLRDELSSSSSTEALTLDQLPFLRACVKEGLRLGMANPTRLTRVVPSYTKLRVENGKGKTFIFPPATVVGCAAYNLHHDPEVFPEPFSFHPERWLDHGSDGGLKRPDMEQHMMPFGHGPRACIGKNLAMHQLHETVAAVVVNNLLEGASTCKDQIDVYEWFNGDIKGHVVDIQWA